MKALISFLVLFSFALQANPFQSNPLQKPGKVSLEWMKENMTKDFGDELFLKERLKRENPLINHGEVRGHKVGNGFSVPGPDSKFNLYKACHAGNDLEFLFLKNPSGDELAIFTNDREKENLAEFFDVYNEERYVGFTRYTYSHGSNPLRGEMFQIEWLNSGHGVLRIVYQDKLDFFLLSCEVL